MKRALVLMLMLAGCAAPVEGPAPVLQSVRLSDAKLTLTLSDATRCSVDWRAAPVGRMDRCGAGYGYAVKVDKNPNVLRQLVQGVMLALGGEGMLSPMAEVVITGPGGTDQVFVMPPREAH
jgi:hypothetical protein